MTQVWSNSASLCQNLLSWVMQYHDPQAVVISGDPTYRGGPTVEVARAIQDRTNQDREGRLYYRIAPSWSWRRLRCDQDYRNLNQSIQPLRDVKEF